LLFAAFLEENYWILIGWAANTGGAGRSAMAKTKTKKKMNFDVEKYLETAGVARKIVKYRKGQTIFSQGTKCQSVLYL
jgi:hypothetical protein